MRFSTPIVCSIHAALTAAGVLAVLPSGKAIAVELQAARLLAITFLWEPAPTQTHGMKHPGVSKQVRFQQLTEASTDLESVGDKHTLRVRL